MSVGENGQIYLSQKKVPSKSPALLGLICPTPPILFSYCQDVVMIYTHSSRGFGTLAYMTLNAKFKCIMVYRKNLLY